MNRYFNTITNTRGDSLPGSQARVLNSSGGIVSIFSDAGGTPIPDNLATADGQGVVDFYFTAAAGQTLQILDSAGNLADSFPDLSAALDRSNHFGNAPASNITTTDFDGETIPDGSDVQEALQALQTAIENAAGAGTSLIYEPDIGDRTEGQTVFPAPDGVNITSVPLVIINAGTVTTANYSWDADSITLNEGVSLEDDILFVIGLGIEQDIVSVDNVVGLPAYITGVLGSRSANMRDIAGYDPTGSNDMASGFQALLAQAATAKVPTISQGGKFLLGSPVSMPRGTDLRGYGAPSFDTAGSAGTALYLAHGGRGLVDAGGTGGCLMSDIVFLRDQPAVVSGTPWTPNDDDFDIYSADMSDFHATRVYHMNSTRGVYMNGNRNRFTDCCGQFYKRGLEVDWSYDTLRVVGTHKWPFFSQADEVRTYMQNNLQLYRLNRVDNPMFVMPFSIWAKYCFYIGHFAGDGPSKPAGTVSKLKLVCADLDIGQHAYYVAPEADGHSATFSAVTSQGMVEIVNAAPIQIEGPNTKISGDFGGSDTGANLVRLEASAAGSELSLFVKGNNWNRSATGFAAIEVVTGGGHVSLLPGSVPLLTNGNGGPISAGNVTVWTP